MLSGSGQKTPVYHPRLSDWVSDGLSYWRTNKIMVRLNSNKTHFQNCCLALGWGLMNVAAVVVAAVDVTGAAVVVVDLVDCINALKSWVIIDWTFFFWHYLIKMQENSIDTYLIKLYQYFHKEEKKEKNYSIMIIMLSYILYVLVNLEVSNYQKSIPDQYTRYVYIW